MLSEGCLSPLNTADTVERLTPERLASSAILTGQLRRWKRERIRSARDSVLVMDDDFSIRRAEMIEALLWVLTVCGLLVSIGLVVCSTLLTVWGIVGAYNLIRDEWRS